jgi:toxin ParE1/3/4
MEIIWSPDAIADLVELREHIVVDDPNAAVRMVQRIIDVIETLLPTQPAMGRPGRVVGTRELVIVQTPYVAPYRIRDGRVEIIRVYHGARKWPERL